MNDAWALTTREFGVAFGKRIVLASVDIDIPARGVVSLVGPAGTGKSTLLRTLAGLNDAQPSLRTWGEVTYGGVALGPNSTRPVLVRQNASLSLATVRECLVSAFVDRSRSTKPEQTSRAREILRTFDLPELAGDGLALPLLGLSLELQRRLTIVRSVLHDPAVVFMDEPTAGLEETAATRVLALIAAVAAKRGVLFVTHNKRHARRLGGTVALLAGGRIIERRRTPSFFDWPETESGKSFVLSGRCSVPGPMAQREELRDSVPAPAPLPPQALAAPGREVGPTGFFWLHPGALGGLPRPGIVGALHRDLAALQRLGITVLVSLEEELHIEEHELHAHGLLQRHFPIDDMCAPTVESAAGFCRDVEQLVTRNDVVALHCRAGLGRTGTMLSCQLIWEGQTPLEALDRARGINGRWVQSDEQIAFLGQFGQWMKLKSRQALDQQLNTKTE